ncbi:phycobilisome rod-core linker polypeptide [Candidatus Venteria ishoeyi]|uniref:phycobilisome rod-core linker polypeptide n=1 Tax=Candidatus Venteria ishoeyi TaxID=1899563 RepID=UPI0015AA9CD8|nr:phycobilisome rod-core linker polypeptide [Candidatus Venteria ishoeyi]
MLLAIRTINRSPIQNAINKFVEGDITVREMVLILGTSKEFSKKFINKRTPNETIVLLYKKFLARNPESSSVINAKSSRMWEIGWKKIIKELIDSKEYIGKFGGNTVPRLRKK